MRYLPILRLVLLSVACPVALSYVVHYGYFTGYSTGFHEAVFRSQYESDIFRYRVLGRYGLLATHSLLQRSALLQRVTGRLPRPALLSAADPQADPAFYDAFFLFNTFWLVVTMVLLDLTLRRHAPPGGQGFASAWVLLTQALIALSLYVFTPYDTLSYALLAAGMCLALAERSAAQPALLGLTMIAATLARESSVLLLLFYWSLHADARLRLARGPAVTTLALFGCFLVTYLGLRGVYGVENAVLHDLQLRPNFTGLRSLPSLALLAGASYGIVSASPQKAACVRFLVTTLPYVAAMLLVAVAAETRLWVPLWLGLVVLGNTTTTKSGGAPGEPSGAIRSTPGGC